MGVVKGELLPTDLRNEPGDFRLSIGELVGVVFGEEGLLLPRVKTDFFTLVGVADALVGVAVGVGDALVGVAVGVGDAFFTSMDAADIFFTFLGTVDVFWVGLWKELRPLGLKIGVLLGLGLKLLREILEGDFENGRGPSSESDIFDTGCGVREMGLFNEGLPLPLIDGLRTGLRELAKRANFFLFFELSSPSRLSVDSFLIRSEKVSCWSWTDPELSSILLSLPDVALPRTVTVVLST